MTPGQRVERARLRAAGDMLEHPGGNCRRGAHDECMFPVDCPCPCHDTSELAALVDLLDQLDCHSYTLNATDTGYWNDRTPNPPSPATRINLRLTIIGRTLFNQVCAELDAKPTERIVHIGQRSWWAEADTPTRRLLVEGVSFQHHPDWQPRTTS